MKDSKYHEVMNSLDTQLKFLEDIRKATIKKKEKEIRLSRRAVSLRIMNVNSVDDYLKWFGTRDWPFIFEEKWVPGPTMTMTELQETLKSEVPNINMQFNGIKVQLDAIDDQLSDCLIYLQESGSQKVSITNIVDQAHVCQIKKTQKNKNILNDDQKCSVLELNRQAANLTPETFDFNGLIGSLDTMTILKKVFASLHMKSKARAVFEDIFLSENTKGLVESIFWWIYLDLLEPKRHKSKEMLFTRMAEKYVALLMSIPAGFNDMILDKIPKALSQATYVAFFDGLRIYHQYFDDNFKQYIYFYITKWTTGITPQPEAGNKEREKMAQLTGERTETIAEMLTQSIMSNTPVKADWNMQDLEDQKHLESKYSTKMSLIKDVQRWSRTKDIQKYKEHFEQEDNLDTLQLERVKFNLYSQCPLVNHCMYNKKMTAIYMIPTNQIIHRLQRTEKTPEKTLFNHINPKVSLFPEKQ